MTVVPAQIKLAEIMALKPDGVFLSNGPGDPAATGKYAVPVIKGLLEADVPLFGICLGHQMLGLAAGAKTAKMHQGHRGANHPVQRVGSGWGDSEGLVEITSMNHGFAVDNATLPPGVEETHVSLFDGTNCGIAITGKKAFGVQYHPEASPGPQDSFYLFEKFVGMFGVMIGDGDRAVLGELAEHGDVHGIPRPVLHYFYGVRQQLYDIAERLEKPGWAGSCTG